MSEIFRDAYSHYFQKFNEEDEFYVEPKDENLDPVMVKEIEKEKNNLAIKDLYTSIINNRRLKADGSVTNVHEACDIIRRLTNVVFGQGWGDFSFNDSSTTDVKSIPFPSIRYSTNVREVSEGESPKPKKLETQKELNNGVPTGDAFDIYTQRFDSIVEFNIRDKDSRSCASLATRFEEMISLYTSVLKEEGISEIFFLKEVPPKYSTSYLDFIPTVTLYYYIRLERQYVIKHSSLSSVRIKMKTMEQHS